ncbi:hypothetical protein ACMGDM_10260 [Sphingomonas sp. DT-51]|uniref:hypothetical protein n=1 Tax=Sphingomonas sp. DT-51 TaxID=3396165 RepID=UPI003F1B045E
MKKTASGRGEPVEIDIVTRVVEDGERIYVVQPGRDYRLYDQFLDRSSVFLDFPDLSLDFRKLPQRQALREEIVKSIAVREWLDRRSIGPSPSRHAGDYSTKTHGRRLGRYAGAIEALYYTLQPGTLIVVPGRGFDDQVLFGELVGPPTYVAWKSCYDGERLPVRRVNWIAKRTRGSLPAELRARLGTPNPIAALEQSLREQVVRAAYDQYIFQGEYAARLKTTKDDFSTLDDFNIQTFVNYVAGVLALYEEGRREGGVTFDEALAALEKHRDLVPDLAQNINSAGFQRLYSSTIAPLAIAALLTLGTDPATAETPHRPAPIVVNSAAKPNDACTIEVKKRVEGAMSLMDADTWKRVCTAVRNAKSHTGLSTSMQVRPREE